MLTDLRPDAVSIVVPTQFHANVALDVIKQKIPMLIEKPIASTVKEATSLVAASELFKVPVMVGHIERFNPVVSAAKSLLDSGAIGDVLAMRGVRVGPFTPRVKDAGVLHILAIHDLDLFQFLSGGTIHNIDCMAVQKKFSQFEDSASVLCETDNGVVCSLEANWCSPKKVRSLTITGTKGILELDYLTQRLVLAESDGGERSVKTYSDYLLYNSVGEQRVIDVVPNEPLKLELSYFLDCVKNRAGPVPSARDGLDALMVVELCKACI